MSLGITLAENGMLPDSLIKYGINQLLKQRIAEFPGQQEHRKHFDKIVRELKQSHIAIETKAANEQHYELPPKFFALTLGKRFKYSSCYYENGAQNLDEAENKMLELYAERAGLKDGMSVLDLGCGWGSFTLWAAEHYPNLTIRSISNSSLQREHIEKVAKDRGFKNIKVTTADINEFEASEKFDRIISVEMFEHMRNYKELFKKVSSWLKDDGKLFVHIFCHKKSPYYFEVEGDDNWMGRYFFTGGIMPSEDLFSQFNEDLTIEHQWRVNGTNYEKTALGWLKNQDDRKAEVMEVLTEAYGPKEAKKWFNRWRIFFLSCAELFGYDNGNEWWVSHYLFSKTSKTN